MSKLNFCSCLLAIIICGGCSSNTCESPTPYISKGRIYFNGFSLRPEGRTIIRCKEIQQDVGTIESDGIVFSFYNLVGMSKNIHEMVNSSQVQGDTINGSIIIKKDTIRNYLVFETVFPFQGEETASLIVASLDDIPEHQSQFNKGYFVEIFAVFRDEQEQSKIAAFFDSLEIEN